jgi:hypothetical protein
MTIQIWQSVNASALAVTADQLLQDRAAMNAVSAHN